MPNSISYSENSRNAVVESNRWPRSSWYPCSAAKPANSPPCASNCVSTLTIIRWGYRVNQYLTANPQVTGFAVADKAVEGKTAEAIVMMRAAVEQGTDPIALIGALAMKLRTIAKASAVRAGTISQAEAKTNPWVLKNAMRQLGGWTSAGLAHCIRMLAWADEQSKTNGGDPVYALERCIEDISHKGR